MFVARVISISVVEAFLGPPTLTTLAVMVAPSILGFRSFIFTAEVPTQLIFSLLLLLVAGLKHV
jgi:hypothetical protein